jgi:hypothetical protein
MLSGFGEKTGAAEFTQMKVAAAKPALGMAPILPLLSAPAYRI